MKRVLLIFGTRPEAIKMAPLIRALRDESIEFDTKVCVTAQHRQMLDQALELFEIQPDYDLDIMRPRQDLYDITVSALMGLREVFQQCQPHLVLVQGDTSTTMATALAAFYEGIEVGHIEAGLRTYRLDSPYPEELNRQLTSRMARYHFAPTEANRANLEKENIAAEKIYVTGNTVIDALLWVRDHRLRAGGRGIIARQTIESIIGCDPEENRYILVTSHRRENFGEGLQNICSALRDIAAARSDLDIIYPVHLNPNVQSAANKALGDCENIHLIEPLEYELFVYLMNQAHLILTDSGGIQEEAPSLGKPVLVMRDTTERMEGVEAGTVKLVGVDQRAIVDHTLGLLDSRQRYEEMCNAINPYGDGKAAERIVQILKGEKYAS